jgi:hypothetical protein
MFLGIMTLIQPARFNKCDFQIEEIDLFESPQSTADPYYPPKHCGFSYPDITSAQPEPATGFPQKDLSKIPDWVEYKISLQTSDRWFLQYTPLRIIAEKYLNEIKKRGGFHPMLTSRWILRLLYCYKETSNNIFLNKSKRIVSELVDQSVKYNESLFFPYLFNYNNFDREFSSPWYSGMAQGVALSALSKLPVIDKNEEYQQYADLVFNSFQVPRSEDSPWIAFIDNDDFYWIEEYPMDPPSHVLNGFITAIWGIYDYWLLTKKSIAQQILTGCLTTLKNHIYKFRNETQKSWYSLNPKSITTDKYHRIHLLQSKILADISRCDLFKEFHHDIQSDYEPTSERIL